MIKWEPHNYQITAISFLLNNPRSGLFLDPGLGKTSTSLSTARILKYIKKTKGVLIIAPLRVCHSVWPEEIQKWSNFKNLTCTILHEDMKTSLHWKKKDIYLINPEGLEWLHKELLALAKKNKPMPFDTLWIDESTKFKSPKIETKSKRRTRFGLLVNMLPLFKRRHIMTGTPAPKSLQDLWSQIYILDEGKALGSNFYQFRNRYYTRNQYNKYQYDLREGAADKIHKAIAHLVLEMSSKDYLDLPELVFNNINIDLSKKAMKVYKEMEKKFFIQIDNQEASASQTAIAAMKCQQIANGKIYEDLIDDEPKPANRKIINVHKSKQEALIDLVDELNGKPLLIAYHYKHDLEAINEALGYKVPYIGSKVSTKRAKQLVKAWNKGELPILAGHPSSMAHGLNMQDGGNDICWYSLTWNLEEYLQFIARIYRQGVSDQVRVHHLIARKTVDQAMLLRLGQRAEQQQDLRTALKRYRQSL